MNTEPETLSPPFPGTGYLMELRDETGPRAWILLRTEGYEPLQTLANALHQLSVVAAEMADQRQWHFSEGSVAGWQRPDLNRAVGRVASLRDYTYTDGTADAERFRRHLGTLLSGEPIRPALGRTGAVARAESFFGRAGARAELLQRVTQQHVMLLAPRRSGKTSLLMQLMDQPPTEWAPVYLDLEQTSAPIEFAVSLAWALRQQPSLGARLDLPELRAADEAASPDSRRRQIEWQGPLYRAIGADWPDFCKRLLGAVGEAPAMLLLLDELGDFLEALDQGKERKDFVAWFHDCLAGPGGHRLIVTGSRHLEHLIERLRLKKAFARFDRFPLPLLEEDAARQLFEERLRAGRIRPAPDLAAYALQRVGPQVPFYVQMLADFVLEQVPEGRDLDDRTVIDAAYEGGVLGFRGQAYFEELEARLKSYDAYHRRRAGRLVLRLIAEADNIDEGVLAVRFQEATGESPEKFKELMALLEEYFFLDRKDGCCRFQVPVLRDYALRYYTDSRAAWGS